MQALQKDLYDIVSDSLHEVSWRLSYPINLNVGLFAFIEAFKIYGTEVDSKEGRIKLNNFYLVNGNPMFLQAELSFEQVLEGWGWSPFGSPRSLYDSICSVFDIMGQVFEKRREEQNAWALIREGDSRRVRNLMKPTIKEYFERYQEHMFLDASGKINELREPELFFKVLNEFNMDLFKEAVVRDLESGVRLTPCPETMLEIDEGEFDEGYHPSRAVMEDYFWGRYLYTLSEKKGWPLDSDSLRRLVARGWDGLEPGSRIWVPKRMKK